MTNKEIDEYLTEHILWWGKLPDDIKRRLYVVFRFGFDAGIEQAKFEELNG